MMLGRFPDERPIVMFVYKMTFFMWERFVRSNVKPELNKYCTDLL